MTGSARPIARGGAVALLALALVACGGIWEEPSSPRTGTFELTSIPDVSVATGEHKYIQLLALGAGDQPVQFTAEGLPPFATLTGDLISLAPERHHAGEALVTVTATSGTLTASRSFTVRVSRTNSAPYLWPPYLEDADGTSLMAGMASDGLWERVARGFPKLTAQIDDSDGDAVQLFVEIVPNGTPFTGVATFTSPATAGGAVEAWGSVYLTGLTPGTYRLQVWAKDVVGEVTAPRDAGRLIYAPRGQRSSAPDWRTCGGASVNVTEDPQHCGACGHDCLGGSCQVGLCTPTQLAATSDFWIDDMELDEGHVYWSGLYTNHFGVKRVPKTGGALQQLASPYMGSLVLDGASFYVTTPGEVVQVPLAGGAPTRLAWGLYAAEGLGLHDGRLYWFLPDESRLWALYSLPKQGGELATREATFAARPQSMVVDASGVYAADIEGGVLHRPATGGSVKVLASGLKEPNGIAVDGEYVYVAYYSPFACWQCTTTLARIPKTGGPLQILATVNMKAGGFTIDDEYIYWTLYGRPADVPLSLGSVMRMPKAGGTPVVLADGHSNVRAIRVDATHVYWIAPEVGVFRVPK